MGYKALGCVTVIDSREKPEPDAVIWAEAPLAAMAMFADEAVQLIAASSPADLFTPERVTSTIALSPFLMPM